MSIYLHLFACGSVLVGRDVQQYSAHFHHNNTVNPAYESLLWSQFKWQLMNLKYEIVLHGCTSTCAINSMQKTGNFKLHVYICIQMTQFAVFVIGQSRWTTWSWDCGLGVIQIRSMLCWGQQSTSRWQGHNTLTQYNSEKHKQHSLHRAII